MIDLCTTPESYAQRLAGYIKNPSTIRVRTLEQWGRAPSLDRCKLFIAAANPPRPRYENDDYIPAVLAKWSCDHEVNADNAYLKDTGEYGCIICRREAQRRAAAAYRARKALDAANQAKAEENARKLKEIEQQRKIRKIARQEKRTRDKGRRAIYVSEVMNSCVMAVCRAGLFNLSDVIGKSREPKLVLARLATFILAKEYNLSYPEMGRWIGRDHSTIIHLFTSEPACVRRYPGLLDKLLAGARDLLVEVEDVAA